MSKRRKWLKKLLTCALSMTILGTAAVLFLTVENCIAITASAAETYGNFQYETENDTHQFPSFQKVKVLINRKNQR